jgi:hypothetical protein
MNGDGAEFDREEPDNNAALSPLSIPSTSSCDHLPYVTNIPAGTTAPAAPSTAANAAAAADSDDDADSDYDADADTTAEIALAAAAAAAAATTTTTDDAPDLRALMRWPATAAAAPLNATRSVMLSPADPFADDWAFR